MSSAFQVNKVQQLYLNAALVFSDFNNDYIGAGLGKASDPTTLTAFDFTGFSQVLVLARAGSLTGGTGPTLGVRLWGVPTPSGNNGSQVTCSELDVSTGAGGILIASWTGMGAQGINNSYTMTTGPLPPWGLLQVLTNGSPTGMTGNALIALYGIRPN